MSVLLLCHKARNVCKLQERSLSLGGLQPRHMAEIPNIPFQEKTLSFAHRGFTAAAPENSLAAFRAAIELGVDGIELDVRVCASGEVVVFHDAEIERMTTSSGEVKALTIKELRETRLLFKGKATDEGVPTLEEVLELVHGRAVLNVEIKHDSLPAGHQIEKKVVALLKEFNAFESTVISCFHPLVVRRLRKIDPKVLNGFLLESNFNVRNSEMLFTKISGARMVHLEKGLLSKSLFNKIKDRGYGCLVWTVNEKVEMQKFLNMGVDGIITDKPDVLLKLMGN